LAATDENTFPDITFGLLHTLFWVQWEQGGYQKAGEVAKQLFGEAIHEDRPERLGLAKLAMSYFMAVQGDLSMAVDLASEAVQHAREIGHPFREADGLMLLGSLEEMVGLRVRARASLEAAMGLATRLKTKYQQAQLGIGLARVDLAQGQVEPALAGIESGVQLAAELEDSHTLCNALLLRARALGDKGSSHDLAEATAAGAAALRLCQGKYPSQEAEARWVLSNLALARSLPTEALEHARAAEKLLDLLGTHELHEVEILLCIRNAYLATGHEAEAQDILKRAYRTLRFKARRIGDEEIREGYLALPHNAQVKALWEQAQPQG
jgi:tetratricopeptide (TPR) repeat protein